MNKNGKQLPRRQGIKSIKQAATSAEAAAISAALEQFLRESSNPKPMYEPSSSPWRRSASYEATGQSPAINTWGEGARWGGQCRARA